jgi:hypothetical protein
MGTNDVVIHLIWEAMDYAVRKYFFDVPGQ